VSLRERIATALGWTVEQVQSFSLPALRDVVRPVSPKLASAVTAEMAKVTRAEGFVRRSVA